jgi:iron complex outermembrane receptor protein
VQKYRFAALALSCAIAGTFSLSAAAQGSVVMPRVVSQVTPTLPADVVPKDADVVLTVTLDATGTVIDVAVVQSGGAEFDQAAMAAVKQWKFTPALRDGQPIAAKIRVPVHFVAAAPPPAEGAELPAAPAVPNARPGGTGTAGTVAASSSSVPVAPPVTPPPQPAQPKAPVVPRPAPSKPVPGAPPEPAGPPAEPPKEPPQPLDVSVAGRRPPPLRGASDFHVDIGALAFVPRANAAKMLELAPSIFLSNEGGEGHAERVYLRGFDAREGQDIEFSVGGVPVNESGNLHGAGFAETHFVIPELVVSLRVLEGPFDPRQGNYAVAGSADYELGLVQRGLTMKYTYGTFNTHRALALWGPLGESIHTFGGVEIKTSDGYGQNRGSKSASAMGQYEGHFGETGNFRLLATAYANDYKSAGLLREADVAAGKKGFYDTYDFGQGGAGSRFSFAADLENRIGDVVFYQQAFVIQRGMRLRENFTGFLLDTQTAIQEPHGQRGDLLDLAVTETTFGARGHGSMRSEIFGQKQELELGYFARGDRAFTERGRIGAATDVPYKTDARFDATLGDIGLYADAALRFTKWLSLRGGVRADLLTYDVLDECAVQDVSRPNESDPPGDRSCLDQQRFGVHREPAQRTTTTGLVAMPRGSLIVGPFKGFTLSLSAGTGVRSVDPKFVTQDAAAQFASVNAYEGGVAFTHDFGPLRLVGRSILFATHVDRDLIFSETEGRNVIGGGTTRVGWIGQARADGESFDSNLAVTLTKSAFDETGLLVPYVPDVVVRWDGALHHELPFEVAGTRPRGAFGFGLSYIGERALPYGQRSDTILTVDAGVTLGYRNFDLGISASNLFDTAYRQAEFNFVSDWHSAGAPTLVPARHFSAGAPREVMFSLSGNFGGYNP